MHKLSAHETRLVAVRAYCDPRTVAKYFEGRAQSVTSARIERALAELGLDHLRREQGRREAS